MHLEWARFLAHWPGWLVKHSALAERREGDPAGASVNLTVLKDGGNASSPLLHGIMFEEMDHSGDGGIHGQLLINNGFQGSDAGITGYKPLGYVDLIQDMDNAVSDAITSSLAVSIWPDARGYVGFANTGYNGVPVQEVEYRCEFWMMGDYSGKIMLRLVGSGNGEVYAEHNVTVRGEWGRFKRFETTFRSEASRDGDNEWQLLFDSQRVKGDVMNFGLVQLFPPTYHDRVNGLRDDIAKPVEGLKPAFLRFPGGNNIEGLSVDSRWKWNETIGPVVHRPGRDGGWHYPNTEALGLDEYLWWCQDMDMVPVLTVWDGKSYGGIVSGDDMHPYIDDILNELEYLLGSPSTYYGALRAKNGRRKPWPIQYIEIGNEDDYSGGCETYPDRLVRIHDAIHKAYPNITLIANNLEDWCLPLAPLPGLMFDYHYYRSPDDLVAMFNYWDNHDRSKEIIVGEYGCRNDSNPDGVFWSFMQASCSEAVHMIGLERNSDVVKMTAYAPLLQHFGFTQWSPTLIGFDSSPGSLTLSTSYYVQRMFSTNRGDTVHPVNTTADFGPVYWVATSNRSSYQVKLANYGSERQVVNVRVPVGGGGGDSGTLEVLSGPQNVSNLPHNVTITPETREVRRVGVGEGYTVDLDPWAVAVLVV
ncbi:alpha-L-arabinofuranosidase A [Aspergillus lucknowensis]|uniref:non-reducing end alpha-L-arabinofuranosidase n=1 Tax=Aspergillus lucknowensis TaxID=176173 RepID=A0ABR4LVF5_9EURO